MSLQSRSIVLNPTEASTLRERSYVVFGAPRGGTTMVAGMCQILGIPMGENLPDNCEDPDFNWLTLKEEVADRIQHMQACVRKRDTQHPVWGWKYPAASQYLEQILPHLRNPHLVCIFRDPLSVARRPVLKRGREPLQALKTAANFYYRNIEVIKAAQVPTLLLSYERALVHPTEFTRELAEFLQCDSDTSRQAAERYISASGGYKGVPRNNQAAAPNIPPRGCV